MYSNEHKQYLKKKKRKKILILLMQIAILATIIITWQLLADFKIINTFITSSPSNVVKTIITLYNDNNLFNNIWTTIYETIISFSLGTIIGIIIAIILWYSNFLYKVIDPYLTIINSLPKK